MAVRTSAATVAIDRNLVLVRRASPVDWFNVLIIRFVLSLFGLFVVRLSRPNC